MFRYRKDFTTMEKMIVQNIYDIRKERNLYFILPEKIQTDNARMNHSCAVIMFLYYSKDLSKYLTYIDNIIPAIDTYIVSNNIDVYVDILQYIERSQRHIQLIKSKNRGRDVSALLVACKDVLQKYEYVCFVHDKKKKDYISKN